jgi:hypothetical protein
MLYEDDGTFIGFCDLACENGYTWCETHKPKDIRDSIAGQRRPAHTGTFCLPSVLYLLENGLIEIVGHFESRWGPNECSLESSFFHNRRE